MKSKAWEDWVKKKKKKKKRKMETNSERCRRYKLVRKTSANRTFPECMRVWAKMA